MWFFRNTEICIISSSHTEGRACELGAHRCYPGPHSVAPPGLCGLSLSILPGEHPSPHSSHLPAWVPSRTFSLAAPVLLLVLLPPRKPCAKSQINTLLSSQRILWSRFLAWNKNLRACDKVRSFSPELGPCCSTAWGGQGSNSTVLLQSLSMWGAPT